MSRCLGLFIGISVGFETRDILFASMCKSVYTHYSTINTCLCVVCVFWKLLLLVSRHKFVSKIELDWPSEQPAADLIAFALYVVCCMLYVACGILHASSSARAKGIFVACNLINCRAMHKLCQIIQLPSILNQSLAASHDG